MKTDPRVIFQTPMLRVVLAARTHHEDKVYTFEESVKDAMGVTTWKHLDIVTVQRGDHHHAGAERRVLIKLLEDKE